MAATPHVWTVAALTRDAAGVAAADPSPATQRLRSTGVLLGMSNEMEAGIVGGLIGAAAVLIGVVGTEWAIRPRSPCASR